MGKFLENLLKPPSLLILGVVLHLPENEEFFEKFFYSKLPKFMLLHAVQIRGDFRGVFASFLLLKYDGKLFGKIRKNSEISVHFREILGPEFWKNFGKILPILEKFRPKRPKIGQNRSF